jgi:hypothetical protein
MTNKTGKIFRILARRGKSPNIDRGSSINIFRGVLHYGFPVHSSRLLPNFPAHEKFARLKKYKAG